MATAPTNLADLLARAAQEAPDAVAITPVPAPGSTDAPARPLTWATLEDEVGRVATGLGAAGLVAGHRVLLCLGNRPEHVVAHLAALRAQAIVVPTNPRGSVTEIARVLADAAPRLAIVEPATAPLLRAAVEELEADFPDAVRPRLVVVDREGERLDLRPAERTWSQLRADRARVLPALQDPERIAALLYTSGTTGRPRGAMLSHRALLANVEQLAAAEPPLIGPDDVVLGALPLFHVYGLNAVLGTVLRQRARLVLLERFDAVEALDVVAAEGCTVLPLAPPVFAQWRRLDDDGGDLRARLAGVRLLLSGSAPLSAEVTEDLSARAGVAVHQGYGLTEAAPVVTSTLLSERARPGSVGAPLPGIELRLVDETGRVVRDPQEAGEVGVRGANLFSGYWPDGADGPDADGWWGTGDVGYLDPDGDLVLVDRLGELIIVSGFNVYPAEVEDVVREVPGVAEAAVIGVPDEATGEAVVAYVRPLAGHGAYELEAAVLARCAVRLARFKRPARVEVVDELPHTVTGKVQRGRLRAYERRRATGLLE
ncbi:AMP-binding protein [Nocardioides sp. TRM66260-LWL]|uniref:class I adenylate-forming enzyme family protein n=1 Tax=Nocardioides sp. TRM66260-LWL TaxID=2874478 RepID=UPI001CC36604|nr:AMP-binding protein [Nocardioides sp. TRM66260-LWL]MBZ5734791.1 AMP-binding protein [Nocardioides sp. TRM66260-LWL]